jgi:hypothetical protein
MRGKIEKTEKGWIVRYEDIIRLFPFTQYGMKELPLNPYDVKQIQEDSQRFDNIDARIAAYPDVNFQIEDFWETGMEEVIRVATLIPNTQSEALDFLAKQAQELDMGYGKHVELLGELDLKEVTDAELKKERNPAYQYFNPNDAVKNEKDIEQMIENLLDMQDRMLEKTNSINSKLNVLSDYLDANATIEELIERYPNDADLGKAIRNQYKTNQNGN